MILAWLVIATFGATALAIALGPHRVGDVMAESDFYGGYAEGAARIQRGDFDASRYSVVGPGYEIALALAGFAFHDLFVAAEMLSVASAISVLVLWFWLIRARAGVVLGVMTVLFMSTNGHFLHYAYCASTDMFALALQAGGMFLLLGREHDRPLSPLRAAAAGITIGTAFLTRYTGVVLLPAGLIAIAFGATSSERRWSTALWYVVGFVALVLPWTVWSWTHGGSTGFLFHHNIAYDVFARAKGIPWDDYQRDLQSQFPTLGHVIARDPAAVFARMTSNVVNHLRMEATSLLTLPVAACGLMGAVLMLKDGVIRIWPILVSGALFFLALVPVNYSERYSLAVLPTNAMLAGWAFASPLLAMELRSPHVWLKSCAVLFALVPAAATSQRMQRHVMSQLPVEVMEVADSLRHHARPGDQVIARKGHISWLAGVRPAGFPFANSIEGLARYTHDSRIRWIYFSWPEAETRPEIAWLLDTAAVVPGLTVRAATHRNPAVLYEVGPQFGTPPAWLANDTLATYHRARAQLLVNSADLASLRNLAAVARLLGRSDESRACLEELAAHVPNELGVWLMMGEVSLMANEPARAHEAFMRARSIDPRNPSVTVGLGWTQLLMGQSEAAAATWYPVIPLTQDPHTLGRMLELYVHLGHAEAEAAVRAQLSALGVTP